MGPADSMTSHLADEATPNWTICSHMLTVAPSSGSREYSAFGAFTQGLSSDLRLLMAARNPRDNKPGPFERRFCDL
jgi:hypothetical protein